MQINNSRTSYCLISMNSWICTKTIHNTEILNHVCVHNAILKLALAKRQLLLCWNTTRNRFERPYTELLLSYHQIKTTVFLQNSVIIVAKICIEDILTTQHEYE